MKPRFSILTLLGITTYMAVTIAGVLDPTSIGGGAIFLIWLAAVIVFASRAAGVDCEQRAFARGFMIVGLICVSAAMFSKNPDDAIVVKLQDSGLAGVTSENYDTARSYVRQSMAHGSLAMGFVGGRLAIYHWRRQQEA